MQNYKELMEDLEATLWKDRNEDLGDTLERYYTFILHQVIGLNAKAETNKTCEKCGASASNVCGGCQCTFYCDKECQKSDRPRHKSTCTIPELKVSTTSTPERPFTVLLPVGKTLLTVFMSAEEIQDYVLFVKAIQLSYSGFDKAKHFAWAHWQTSYSMACEEQKQQQKDFEQVLAECAAALKAGDPIPYMAALDAAAMSYYLAHNAGKDCKEHNEALFKLCAVKSQARLPWAPNDTSKEAAYVPK